MGLETGLAEGAGGKKDKAGKRSRLKEKKQTCKSWKAEGERR